MAYQPYNSFPSFYNSPMQQPVYQPPQPPQPPQNAQGLSAASRLVSSKEEAGGVPADFSGSLMLFPDISHNRIYLKRWNYQTGAADFMEFAPVTETKVEAPEFATKEDIKRLEEEIQKIKEVKPDVE